MREIHIDLSSDYYLQQPKVFGGYVGEHNESKLIVKLPNRMVRDDISYYYFEFQTALGEHITSPNIYKNTLSSDNEISIVLWEQLLASTGNLNFCVNAINLGEDGSVTIKGKTSVCTLYISESPTGNDVLIDSKGSKEELQKSIDSALKEAKDSGEFKGDKGNDGYTPQKGVDYFTDDDIADLNIPSVDQTYSPISENAQSGKAVAGAVKTLIGTNIGNPAADTIWGAKNYADAVVGTAKNTLIGSDSDTGDSDTIKGAKKYTDGEIETVNSSISNINTNLEFINNALPEKQDQLEFNTAYDASTNKVATMADVTNAIDQSYNPESANAQSGVAVSQAISNKVDKIEGKGLSTNDFTEEYKSKLDGIESGAKVNVQSDWNQEDTSADDYIKNKPVVDQNYDPTSSNAQSGIAIASVIGDIETALDSIIAMQNSYIGGNS